MVSYSVLNYGAGGPGFNFTCWIVFEIFSRKSEAKILSPKKLTGDQLNMNSKYLE